MQRSSVPARQPGRPTTIIGFAAGMLATLGFTVVHAFLILDIWFSFAAMAMVGALCGLSIVWSYNAAIASHSARGWFAFNGALAVTLLALGAASYLALEPRFTIAELQVAQDPLGMLVPPALPLMLLATVAGTITLWMATGRDRAALVPILVTQVLLVLLVGHNVAIVGLLEPTADVARAALTLAGLIVFLAAAYAILVPLLEGIRARFVAAQGR